MTLEEQVRPHAQYWDCYNDEPLEYNHTGKLLKIIHSFTIGFGEWMTSGVEFIDDTEIGRIYEYKHKKYTTKELLEIYKKENKL